MFILFIVFMAGLIIGGLGMYFWKSGGYNK